MNLQYPPPETPIPVSPLQAANPQATDLQAMPSAAELPGLLATLASLHITREPLAAALDTVDKEIDRVMTQAHQAMSTMGARRFENADYIFELKKKIVYRPTDWPAIHAHITATGEFDIVQRRLSSTALQQRTELPPGIMQAAFDEPHFAPVKGKR
jgi:hypothetical protein